MLKWPPQYKLRTSVRAKRVQLQFSPIKGLELIVPIHGKRMNINGFLNDNREWIEQRFEELEHFQYQCAPESFVCPPKALVLPAIAKSWDIRFSSILYSGQSKYVQDGQNLIFYAGRQQETRIAYIKLWLAGQAKQVLGPWLKRLSNKTQLLFKSYSIRGQKHCWGSCSSQKRISLNYKLLFLPKKVVNYVLLHELCHLKHCDHSDKFWALVHRWEPNYKVLDKLSRQGDCYVPPWLS